MRSLFDRAALGAGVLLLLGACSSDPEPEPPPDFKTVFDTLPPPTPNKLRGVWATKEIQPDGRSVETHIRFDGSFVVGAARCLPPDKSRSIIAGGSAKLETTALDEAKGTFKMGALAGQSRDGDLACSISLAGNTYDFVVAERRLTLTLANTGGSSSFEKVGD